MTDPIADLLTRIRNASSAEHEKVDIPSSKLKVRHRRDAQGRGVHQELPRPSRTSKQGTLRVYLKYGAGNERIISGPGAGVARRAGASTWRTDKIPSILGGMGVAMLSTSARA